MTNESNKARVVFLEAIEYAPEERAAFLDDACHEDPELRDRVERLLRSHEQLGSFHDMDANRGITLDRPITEKPGTRIGPYKLLQQLGEGGMGVVYMAEQKQPVKRRVALKIIKPGMDTRQVIARFEAERQALAMMDHPNIARVLDAGATESGRPYFVMELVNGLPVTKYCDEQHLTPKERLELFVPICQAVQHAHQKGIIHRDLKPSNILVALYDGQPIPKVIDFGVAKATNQTLTDKTMFTQLGQVVGTLEYMSPEQAERNQLDVDTRSDIYSLGVVLYELLTGDTPFDRARLRSSAFEEMLRIIREEEPPRPSTRLSSGAALPSIAANRHIEPKKLSTLVRGELDWIVMKALEKDRARRYETASKFAEDVRHYLNDEAVVACPPSTSYRLRKFARKNKAAIATASAIAVALIVGTTIATWQAFRASRERDRAVMAEARTAEEAERADTEAQIAKAVNDFLRNDLLGMTSAASQVEKEMAPDPHIELRTLLDRAAERIEERFIDQPRIEAAIRETIGNAYHSIGDFKKAEKHHGRALEIFRRTYGDEHPNTGRRMNDMAIVYLAQGRYDEARKLHLQNLEILGRTLGEEHPDTLITKSNLANVYSDQGRYDKAETLLRQTLEIRRRMVGEEHPDTLASMGNLANVYWRQARYDKAETLHRQTLDIRRRTLGEEHPTTLQCSMNLANVYARQGRYEEAESLYRQHLPIKRRVLGEDHPITLDSVNGLAVVCAKQAQYDEAEKLFRQTLEIRRRTLGEEHPKTLTAMSNLTNVYADQGRYDEVETLHRQTLEIRRRTVGEEHPDTLASMTNLASAYYELKRYKEAETLYRQTLEIHRRTLGEEHPRTLNSRSNLAMVLDEQEHHGEAETLYLEALEIQRRTLGAEHPDTLRVMMNLAVVYWKQARYDDADSLYSQTLETQKRILGEEHPSTLATMMNLAIVYKDQGRHEEAETLYRKALEVQTRVLGTEHPKTNLTKRNLGALYTNRCWRLATASNDQDRNPEEALRLARLAVDLDPNSANSWDNLGVACHRSGQWDEAIDALEKAREMRNGNDRYHQFFLAMAYWQAGKEHEAVRNYVEAAKWLARETLAAEQYRFRDEAEELFSASPGGMDSVLQALSEELEEFPKRWPLRIVRAHLFTKQQSWEKAAAEYATVIDREDASRTWPSPRQEICRKIAASPQLFDHVAQLRPDEPAVWIGRGQYYALRSQWTEAASDYARADPLQPIAEQTYQYAGLLLITDNEDGYRKFCGELSMLAGEPNDNFAAFVMARSCAIGPDCDVETDRILAWAKQGVTENRTAWELHVLGLAQYRAGNFKEAIQSLEASNAGNWPALAKAQNDLVLGMAYHDQGEKEKAQQRLHRANAAIEQARPRTAGEPVNVAVPDWIGIEALRSEAQAIIEPADDERINQGKTKVVTS